MIKYYFIKTTTLMIYLITTIYCWWFMFAPVIALHGFWKMLGIILSTFAICFITSYIFFLTRKPQATHKKPSWTTKEEYQEYFDSINVSGDIHD